ncbi:envelope stress response protein PspG [Edwardsiella ictaluri]|uniref:Phage shock protein G, putative n=1 Tax=Edwardsiella ictaluri (strain 93-146) TaxID=634503 RepID=C5B723_EDWI9|nr:envelope stress response protein PspG [Edwardsiella ictaluri]ACR67485.1 phage shock protein G, putative [Edwardsiella ictaluri 93-146]AVZ82021.1 envelope stress response protein PspG [Edwardsiella ictaluri]EKS7763393.1 envelope stress response protein PspG [Edwardsiella ictaluri]EKS7770213.1 envelope stress response protein PspG [Edwardsiella ictaluri]EKS7773354.1 envelope stress response protein PspG [Edwardsiella ictaluri]
MLEVMFVLAFFMMLLLTGISLLGVIAALAVAALLLVFGGLFVLVIKLLPWLALAIVVVWLYRALQKKQPRRY